MFFKDEVTFKPKIDIKIGVFIGLYITSLLANLTFGYRYMDIWGMAQSGGVLIFPLSFIISDITTELYGSDFAKKVVYLGIACQLIFAIYGLFLINMSYPRFLTNSAAYETVFSPYLRFAIASSLAIWIGSVVNIILLSKLSEYVACEFFAVRSFISSTIAELIVTITSMLIANYGRMSPNDFVFMTACCFGMKTIISIIAIWPASIVVHFLSKNNDIEIWSKNPIKFVKNIIVAAWRAKTYIYLVEKINLASGMVCLYYKGTRGIIKFNIQKLIEREDIISKFSPADAAYIGYYYSMLCEKNSFYPKITQFLKSQGKKYDFEIVSITRQGEFVLRHNTGQCELKKSALDIYRNTKLIGKINPNQCLLIGFNARRQEKSIQEKIHRNGTQRLRLVSC